ncbi:MAG: hypothetical protein WD737_00330 [Gemmatimonadota bacterium]
MAIQKFVLRGLSRDDEPEVEQALRSIRGVIYAAASHSDGCAEVEFEDDMVTTDALRQALERIGLEARLAG